MASHYISALLVAALNMAGRQVSVDDNALRAIASEVTNAQFCSAENTEILTNIRHSSLWVSADPDRCAHWKSGIDNAEAISGQITLADHRVPIVIYANRAGLSRPNSIEHIILHVTGGPGIPISPLGYESAYFFRSSASSVMVTVGYSGTSHNSQYLEENFTIATRQIVEIGQLLRA